MPVRTSGRAPRPLVTGIAFHHPAAFWMGTALIVTGVLFHLPEFAMAGDRGYALAGMPMSNLMLMGMAMILGGMGLAFFGLVPRKHSIAHLGTEAEGYRFKAMDDAPLTRAHWGLLTVLGVALIVDVMKPATLGFSIPGMKEEYGLTTAQVALFPLSALTGTTVGSFLWGMLADKLGRRATILLASLIFIGTAICGFMPAFGWNLVMCFIMGMSAGGMLPIVYALMAESVPAKKRGWLVVLHGGLGTVGGYLAASGLAALLEPHFSWRILWFMGLPTGGLVLLMNRWIPESPRFLLERGRVAEARQVMARYGVVLESERLPEGDGQVTPVPDVPRASQLAGLRRLFRQPYLPQTMCVGLYGLGWGLVNWGFLTFLPTILRDDLGYDAGSTSGLLFMSAVIAVPGTLLVAWLYGKWSSKKSMVLYATATAITLLGFAVFGGPAATGNRAALSALVVALLVSSGGIISMLSPYTAEVYPTHLRGTGSGLAAGSSKLGGMIGPPLIAGVLSVTAGLTAPAFVVIGPVALSAILLGTKGIETRGRRLEEIHVQQMTAASRSPA